MQNGVMEKDDIVKALVIRKEYDKSKGIVRKRNEDGSLTITQTQKDKDGRIITKKVELDKHGRVKAGSTHRLDEMPDVLTNRQLIDLAIWNQSISNASWGNPVIRQRILDGAYARTGDAKSVERAELFISSMKG